MWHRLSHGIIEERTKEIGNTKGIPKIIQAILATLVYGAVLFGLSYLNGSINLQNASALTLIFVLIATVAFMYFILVKNRKAPVIFICFDCQEAFHAQATCPACASLNVSDIRLAEWVEE